MTHFMPSTLNGAEVIVSVSSGYPGYLVYCCGRSVSHTAGCVLIPTTTNVWLSAPNFNATTAESWSCEAVGLPGFPAKSQNDTLPTLTPDTPSAGSFVPQARR